MKMDVFRTALLIIILLLSIGIAIMVLSGVMGIDYGTYLSLVGQKTEASDYGYLMYVNQYSYMKDYTYDGFVLANDDGLSTAEMGTFVLSDGPIVKDCSECKLTETKTYPDGSHSYNKQCKKCGDVEDPDLYDADKYFGYCVGCTDSATGNVAYECSSCVDMRKETAFCDQLKQCIYMYRSDPEYYSQNGCLIDIYERAEDQYFDISWINAAISHCSENSLMWTVDSGIQQEVCQFNTDSVATATA
jgi:hypothetical protein